MTKKRLRDVKFPEGAIVGCIIHNGSVEIPIGDSQVNPQDRVVVFCLPKALKEVEKYFT